MLLNLDAGERDDEPEALWRLFDILAIACGGHAGDARSMDRMVRVCLDAGISIGAHPSYPDRDGFGRRSISISPDALAVTVTQQCTALAEIAETLGGRVDYVKPHGALYHDASADELVADAVVRGILEVFGEDISIIGPPEGALRRVAASCDLAYLREGFADRAVRPDGTLVPRTEPGALIEDPALAIAHARLLVSHVDTICVHADTPAALAIARALREGLDG